MDMERIILILFCYFQIIGVNNAELTNPQEDYELDPKEAFFRHLRSYDIEHEPEYIGQEELPKPGGLQITDFDNRNKRSYHVLPSPGLQSHFKINLSDDKSKYKRNKRSSLNFKPVVSDTEEKEEEEEEEEEPCTEEELNITSENPTTLSIKESQDNNISPQDLIINDFIRFKRDSEVEPAKPEADQIGLNSRSKREPEIRTEKMVMERDFNEPGADREPRGATKEQWIKQPYPVERPVDDNVPSASDSIRAPRVHFVTQRRPGQNNNNPGVIQDNREPHTPQPPPGPPVPQPPPYHRMHDEREGRARDFDPYSRPLPPPPPQSPYYPAYPRQRSYDPYRPRYYEPYFERDRFDDRRYGFDGYDQRFDRDRDSRPMMPQLPLPPPPPPGNKQRRIIYYATLPEVVRTPSPNNADYRYRYRYQDGYDDRAPGMTSSGRLPPGAPPGPPGPADYRGGKPYTNQLQKHRDYDRANAERKKTPLYPVKVSTDVNVREPKKSPERRVYSEVERRYNNYKPPSFQTAEESNF